MGRTFPGPRSTANKKQHFPNNKGSIYTYSKGVERIEKELIKGNKIYIPCKKQPFAKYK
jgi:hypothetical protein